MNPSPCINSGTQVREIKIADISIVPELQIRARLNPGIVRNYGELLQSGTKFPPVLVYRIDGKLALVDGHHRREARLRACLETIPAFVQDGNVVAAFTAAIQANASHGLRFTNADKKQTVMLAFQQFSDRSDRSIAELCLVSDRFVNKVRASTGANGAQVRVGRDGKRYKPRAKTKTCLRNSGIKKIQELQPLLRYELFALCGTNPQMAKAFASSLRVLAKEVEDRLSETKRLSPIKLLIK